MKSSELSVKLDLQSERKQHRETWLSASSNYENKIMSSLSSLAEDEDFQQRFLHMRLDEEMDEEAGPA